MIACTRFVHGFTHTPAFLRSSSAVGTCSCLRAAHSTAIRTAKCSQTLSTTIHHLMRCRLPPRRQWMVWQTSTRVARLGSCRSVLASPMKTMNGCMLCVHDMQLAAAVLPLCMKHWLGLTVLRGAWRSQSAGHLRRESLTCKFFFRGVKP